MLHVHKNTDLGTPADKTRQDKMDSTIHLCGNKQVGQLYLVFCAKRSHILQVEEQKVSLDVTCMTMNDDDDGLSTTKRG